MVIDFNSLTPCVVKSVGRIDEKIRVSLLFSLRHLGRYSPPRLGFTDRLALHQPRQLDLGIAEHNYEFIETLLAAGFDHQRGVDDRDAAGVFRFTLTQPRILRLDHERVDDRI